MKTLALTLSLAGIGTLFLSSSAYADTNYGAIIDAAIKNPWGPGDLILPVPPGFLRGEAANEMAKDVETANAMTALDSTKENTSWFAALKILEAKKAVGCLQIVLDHPSDDVQIKALEALDSIDNSQAVPFLLIYAQYVNKNVEGSENATIQAIKMETLANTLSGLTGIEVKVKGQDCEALKHGISEWMEWLGKQKSR
jgi:hypothetical protein